MHWTPNTGLNCTNCPSPIATPYATQQYNLEIKNWNGCVTHDYTKIYVQSSIELYIPNSFSPLAEHAENKVFKLYSKNILRGNMKIFNRWGEKVFDGDRPDTLGWDGFYKGERAPQGVYTYSISITYLDGRKLEKQGSLNLLW